ncbi:UDP-N-acetylmuramoyl-tripeptide--D-alanyl-D-alanine ligase [Cohnella soli]|uniref:UDP-N-acetylmuramoyl-tripeptide--D-alanyl-D-alanine ligase n=1 Tax=Cohnella soli TaxID=425005 RepID=A0ABW0HR92_9BACL
MQANIRDVAVWAGAVGTTGRNEDGNLALAGVSTDTRRIQPGQLFVPLRGEKFDGHEYVVAARDAGASAALWDESVPVPAELTESGFPLILVNDTLTALQALASGYANTLQAKVIAVTGSNGKTTTKDLIASVLSTTLRVHKTEGNYNNHIGLPLTLLGAPSDTEALVLEMGMSGEGEIALLSAIGRPDIAVVTNVGESHLLQLGSRRNIARAKLEIVDGLKPGGALVYYGDEHLLVEELAGKRKPDGLSEITFGVGASNDWKARSVAVSAEGTTFVAADADGAEQTYELPIPGKHNAVNALAAIAVGKLVGLSADDIREGLKNAKLTGMRIERTVAKNGAIVLNDAYNASPTSVRAAIDLVAGLTGYGRKWIVLGDMLELGPDEAAMHANVGAYVEASKADEALFYGVLSENGYKAAVSNFPPGAVQHYTDKYQLADDLLNRLHPDDLVLVKASRGMKMEEIVTILQKGDRG